MSNDEDRLVSVADHALSIAGDSESSSKSDNKSADADSDANDNASDSHAEESGKMRLHGIERAITNDDVLALKDLLPTEYIDEAFDILTLGLGPHLTAPETRVLVRSTAIVWASAVGSTKVVRDLLGRGADVLSELGKVKFWSIDETLDASCSAFHLAAMNGHTDVLKMLFKRSRELLELRTERGETALFLAAQGNRETAVAYLLRVGADPAATQSVAQTALHVACAHGYGGVCQALLNSISRNDESDDRAVGRAVIMARDSSNNTAFNLAARNRHAKILLQLLENPVYFPRSFFKFGIILPDISDKEAWRAYSPLDDWKKSAGKIELSRHGAAVAYWALMQKEGFSNFVDICDKVPLNRDGASWVHVAAMGGDVKMMEHFAQDPKNLLARGRDRIMPLHIAAAYGHLSLVKYMLPKLYSWYQECYANPLEALLKAIEQDTTAVEFAALGGPGQQSYVEQFLWNEVHRLVGEQHEDLEDGFFRSYFNDSIATGVLELAAKCATPGKEDKLLWLFQLLARDIEKQWHYRPQAKLRLKEGRNALHWAIYFQMPSLVWWLLGNGAYNSEVDISHGLYINRECRWSGPATDGHANTLIQELLLDSPPIPKRRVLSGYNDAPSFKYKPQRYHDDAQAAITDFYNIQGHSHFQLKRREIRDITYESGPQKIMHLSDYPDTKALNARLERLRRGLGRDALYGNPPETHDLRWFHFSSNDLCCVEELLVRLSRDQGVTNKNHLPLARFVRESCVQLPAGGKKFYIKPQCLSQLERHISPAQSVSRASSQVTSARDDAKELVHKRGIVAFYVPYLSWMEWPPKISMSDSDQRSDSDQDLETPENIIQHEPMTLDQYYYVSLDDTQERDRTQVLGRYIRREKERTETTKLSNLKQGHLRPLQRDSGLPKNTQNEQSCDPVLNQDEKASPILSVSQLWLWILDGKTIITCTAEEPHGVNESFLQRLLNKLKTRSKNSTMSAESVAEVIASTAVGLLNEKLVPVLGTRVSPLEVFRASIGYVRSSEADLFKEFQSSLSVGHGSEATAPVGKTDPQNAYHNIGPETALLREVKDICDELNILKTLAEDQENVWQQALTVLGGNGTTFGTSTPSEVKKIILEMIHDAEVVQKSLDTLLDLKQKQANLTEAQFTRQQAQDTAKQTDTVLWFTVVTIIFLPLSFLTSLFALNVSDFPHRGDEVVYQGWWIFPIIFGVSTIVSAFFLSIAFKANSLKILFWKVWDHLKSVVKKMFRRGLITSPALDDKV